MQSDDKAPDYGESDIEAKAMTEASSGVRHSPPPRPASTEAVGPPEGTTEIDIEEKLREKQRRETNN